MTTSAAELERELAQVRQELAQAQRDLLQRGRLAESAQRLARLGAFESDMRTGERFWSDQMFRIHGLEPQASPPRATTLIA